MSRWFRHYAGMMRDEKLVAVAIRSKQPVERVIWVWGAVLESAAEVDDAGRFELDPAEAAYFLRADEADICAVLAALAAAGRVAEGRVVKWGDRQYQSDKSAERQARYRARRRASDGGSDDREEAGDVNQPSRDVLVTPQETDTDTEEVTKAIALDASPASIAPAYVDAKHELWGEGPSLLEGLGIPPSQRRSLIGRWCRDCGDDHAGVLDAIRRARDAAVQDPIAWISRAIPTRANHDRNRQNKPRPGADVALDVANELLGRRRDAGGGPPEFTGAIDAQRHGTGIYRVSG